MENYAGTNVIDFAASHGMFRNPEYRFEVSSRKIVPAADAIDYLKIYYPYLDVDQIDSVFGNALYPSRFYGGRSYDLEHSLTERQIATLGEHGKGVSLTLTGHHFDEEVFRANRHFLASHHSRGNAIVCTNDELARRIREEFPDYLLKASLIKHLNTLEKVERALTLYDRVVIPMDKNDDDAFLESLPEKHRIVLFANANCAYNCPARTCYAAISQVHWGNEYTKSCSKKWIPRPEVGHTFFDVDKLAGMGFHHFKMVPTNSSQADMFLRSRVVKMPLQSELPEPAVTLHSFPKCGRTWLRTLLAHYFNHRFSLHVPVDMQTLFTIIPNDHGGLKGREHYQFAHIADMPLLLASHAVEAACNDGDILLLRSIPDVVVSDYFQQQKLGVKEGDMDRFIDADNGSLMRYCRYLNRWAEQGAWKRMHLITYEGLHRDTSGELARLLKHLNIPVESAYVEAAVNDSSFEQMRKAEKVAGHAGMPKTGDNPEMMKVRKGKVGGYSDYLSASQVDRMQVIAQNLLSDEAKAMLLRCGLNPALIGDATKAEQSTCS